MSSWTPARPSIEKKLKELGFKDNELSIIWKDNPADRQKLKANVDKLIQKKRDKEKQIKKAINESFPGIKW